MGHAPRHRVPAGTKNLGTSFKEAVSRKFVIVEVVFKSIEQYEKEERKANNDQDSAEDWSPLEDEDK